MFVVALAATAIGLPTPAAVLAGVRTSGWSSADGLPDRERFPIPFVSHQRIAYLRSQNGALSVEITALGRRAGRLDSLGVKVLFDPRSPGADLGTDLTRFAALLDQIGLPAAARDAALAVTERMDRLPDPADMPLAKPMVIERQRARALVVDSRGRFVTGVNGRYGQALLQFTPEGSPELDWPTVQEVEALVPYGRRVMLIGNSDVPAVLDPAITTMACRRIAAGYRCRYRTTIADWIGKGAPRSSFNDVYRREPDGRWSLLTP